MKTSNAPSRTCKCGKIETIFETQAQIGNLKHTVIMKSTDLKEALDWTSGHWSNDSLLDPKLAAQFTSTLFAFSDSSQCLGGNCQEHLEAAKTWENDRTREFVQSPEYQA